MSTQGVPSDGDHWDALGAAHHDHRSKGNWCEPLDRTGARRDRRPNGLDHPPLRHGLLGGIDRCSP
ncbi:MAG: hypothetical protein HC812_02735 [Leptolyngbya sp. RL_3_1]|nr:hypothetical protein [Leptolyngbya sp. RL_3_1]